MKRYNISLFSLMCFLLASGVRGFSQASPPVSASGHIFAEIIPVFSASETSQMNFGRFFPGPQGGQIVLTPEGTLSILGSVYKGSGTQNAASFYVTGDKDASYVISLPTSPIVLRHSSSAKTMRVENWVSIPAAGGVTGKLQNGFQEVYVGATLKVGTINDNPVGKYTGTYNITFEFN